MKMRFKPTGEIIDIEDYCGQPTVCLSIPPKYQIKGIGEFVLCSDCEMIDTPRREAVHYDQIANFQAKPADSPAVIKLNEKVEEVLSHDELFKDTPLVSGEDIRIPNIETLDYDIIINCEKITLTNNGIDIIIPKDLSSCKSIIINGIKYTREE